MRRVAIVDPGASAVRWKPPASCCPGTGRWAASPKPGKAICSMSCARPLSDAPGINPARELVRPACPEPIDDAQDRLVEPLL